MIRLVIMMKLISIQQIQLLSDSDNDGLTDDYEVYISSTDPNDSDSDNDGLPDGFEINYGGSINMNANS